MKKVLYGLKQAPRIWYNTLKDTLEKIGFTPIKDNTAVFVKGSTTVIVYIDDLLLVGPDKEQIKATKQELSRQFKITDLNDCAYFLGIKIDRNREKRVLRLL